MFQLHISLKLDITQMSYSHANNTYIWGHNNFNFTFKRWHQSKTCCCCCCVFLDRYRTDSGGSAPLWSGLSTKASQEGADVVHCWAAAGRLCSDVCVWWSTAHCHFIPSVCVCVCFIKGDAVSVRSGQQPWCSDSTETGRNDGTEQTSHTGTEFLSHLFPTGF